MALPNEKKQKNNNIEIENGLIFYEERNNARVDQKHRQRKRKGEKKRRSTQHKETNQVIETKVRRSERTAFDIFDRQE